VITACSRCGQSSDHVDGKTHLPLRESGWFCAAWCPACNPQPAKGSATHAHR
jgi:hypothetical protein